ncbi:hypothetical protein BASA81_005352 [Batrachochytrium salamandrivorans]|nr:hypothetical protein BASA81_005352 [Batrachochytrium salamandrivorans]
MLVLGATGGIGKQVVKQLLEMGEKVEFVRALVRSASRVPTELKSHPKLQLVEIESIDKVSVAEMAGHLQGCSAVLICLGHTMSVKGLFFSGMLVLEATKLVCQAIEEIKPKSNKIRLVEVSSIGIPAPDGADEGNRALPTRLVLGSLAATMPPLKDTFLSAKFLFDTIKHDHLYVDWCAPPQIEQIVPNLCAHLQWRTNCGKSGRASIPLC